MPLLNWTQVLFTDLVVRNISSTANSQNQLTVRENGFQEQYQNMWSKQTNKWIMLFPFLYSIVRWKLLQMSSGTQELTKIYYPLQCGKTTHQNGYYCFEFNLWNYLPTLFLNSYFDAGYYSRLTYKFLVRRS